MFPQVRLASWRSSRRYQDDHAQRFWTQAPNCFESEAEPVVPSPHRIRWRCTPWQLPPAAALSCCIAGGWIADQRAVVSSRAAHAFQTGVGTESIESKQQAALQPIRIEDFPGIHTPNLGQKRRPHSAQPPLFTLQYHCSSPPYAVLRVRRTATPNIDSPVPISARVFGSGTVGGGGGGPPMLQPVPQERRSTVSE
jgi:hypothetical protein